MHLDLPSTWSFSDMQLQLLLISAQLSDIQELMIKSEEAHPGTTWHDIKSPPLGPTATEILYHYFDVASVSHGPGVTTYRVKYKRYRDWN